MSPLSSQSSQLGEGVLESLSRDVLIYLLAQVRTKIPVKRLDIVKNVLKNYSKSYEAVMERVKSEAKRVYGLDLVKVNHPTKPIILVNTCSDMSRFVDKSPEQKAEEVLLMLVLSFVFMRNNVVREDVLWDFLEKLDLVKRDSTFNHEYFGDVRKAVSKVFVRQLYLEHSKVPDSDPPRFEFSLGQRALLEVSHRSLLQFVCAMYGTDKLETWPDHFARVVKHEKGGDDAADLETSPPVAGCSRSSQPSQRGRPFSQQQRLSVQGSSQQQRLSTQGSSQQQRLSTQGSSQQQRSSTQPTQHKRRKD